MKIDAGLELKTRNPRSAAVKVISIMTSVNWFVLAKLRARKHEAIKAIPAANPSMISAELRHRSSCSVIHKQDELVMGVSTMDGSSLNTLMTITLASLCLCMMPAKTR